MNRALCLIPVALLLLAPARAQPGLADLELVEVIPGSFFVDAVAVRAAGDGSGRLFVVEQAGRIRVWDGDQVLPAPFLDISATVYDVGNEQGLLGLAFHPDFENNGQFFVNYTEFEPSPPADCPFGATCNANTVVERYQLTGDPNVADPASAFPVLTVNQDFSNHNGGDLHFGPDGYLYIGMGDGGSGGDPFDRAQDLGSLLGKMLRIDVDSPPRGMSPPFLCGLVQNYAIPPSNPFVTTAGACDEIWALGLRNPWRWSFDRLTGDLLIGDVGQLSWEEIDFQPASSSGGENYGWDCREGMHDYELDSCPPGPLVEPIIEYGHTGGRCSVTGGYRYRGNRIRQGLPGTYIYADYCTGEVFFATENAGIWQGQPLLDLPENVTSFGEGEDGEVYVVAQSGTIYRFESEIFSDNFESGDLAAWSSSVGN